MFVCRVLNLVAEAVSRNQTDKTRCQFGVKVLNDAGANIELFDKPGPWNLGADSKVTVDNLQTRAGADTWQRDRWRSLDGDCSGASKSAVLRDHQLLTH